MTKPFIALQPSEGVIVSAAAQIYAGYVVAGRATEGEQDEWLQRSIREAVRIARTVDSAIQADQEVD